VTPQQSVSCLTRSFFNSYFAECSASAAFLGSVGQVLLSAGAAVAVGGKVPAFVSVLALSLAAPDDPGVEAVAVIDEAEGLQSAGTMFLPHSSQTL